jgi:hypothetical protein
MYNNYAIPITMAGALVMVIFYFILIWVGTIIEALPSEKRGKRSLSSPIPATRLWGIGCIMVYAISACTVIMTDETIYFIIGIVGQFAAHMAMMTAIIFSFAVINAINAKNKAKVTGVGNGESSIL